MAATHAPFSNQVATGNLKGQMKHRIDPSRALEPTRKKLTTLETQRVMAVWDESLRRTEILSSLPYILENMNDFSVALGREIVTLLQEHQLLKDEYDEISSKLDIILGRKEEEEKISKEELFSEDFWTRPRSEASSKSAATSKSGPDGKEGDEGVDREKLAPQQDEFEERLQDLQPKIQFNVRNILRAFRSNPAAITAVTSAGRVQQRSKSSVKIFKRMTEMKDIMVLRLMTTPSEKTEKLGYLYEISTRERANAQVIEKLETELHEAIDDKDAEVKKKNDIIRRLQADIHHLEKFSEDNIKKIKTESEKQQQSDTKNSEGRIQKLSQERTQLATQLENLIAEHRDAEGNLRNRKYKLETEVENWIQKFDNDMGERQDEYEEIDAAYTEEKKQLFELEERFKTLEEEYNQIQEERRMARERREAAEKEMQRMVLAATCIQSFWRSYKVRKVLRGKGKKGKGKGKKKK